LPAASGWRLETARKCDKKKPELYFCSRTKKFLTEKTSCAVAHFFPREILPSDFFCENLAVIFSARMKRALLPALLLFVTLHANATELLPPFGFRWGDGPRRVEAVLNGAKARITDRKQESNRTIWNVDGLVHPGLRQTVFTFRDDKLIEVELQYEYNDWSIERYNEQMGVIRRYFDSKYGVGKLVSRTGDSESDVVQTLVGYQWMVGATMLELFYFSAEKPPHTFRTITVDYKSL
jgi:hypothetical protein